MSNISCGIDFGTSNSTVSVTVDSVASLVPLEDGKKTLPSSVFFKKQSAPLFGREAMSAYLDGEEGRLMRGLKKILGTSLMDDKTMIGSRSVNFKEILEVFINHLKAKAEDHAGEAIENVVMGRPVHFHDNNPDADDKSQATLEKIARAAGFKNIQFLYEPIAAAFAHEAKIAAEKLSLVVDLGGGTSDFTIIRISNAKMNKPDRTDDILATSGVRIGGTTFDYRLSLKNFMPHLGMGGEYHDLFDKEKWLPMPSKVFFELSDWAMVHQAQTKKAVTETKDIKRRAMEPEKIMRLLKVQENQLGHALLEEVEKSKISLTTSESHVAHLDELGADLGFSSTKQEFETAIAADVEKIVGAITSCLSQAGIASDKIELVILTGGSTELPLINHMIKGMFPHATLSQGDKLDSVGLGLAYHAGHAFGKNG